MSPAFSSPAARKGEHATVEVLALAVATLLLVCLSSASAWAQAPTADYEITFDATWSAQTHPTGYPNNAHFSPLIGGTHDDGVVFWAPGGIASYGIEVMAETGDPNPLHAEIQAEVPNGFASGAFFAPRPTAPGQASFTLTVDHDFPLLTLVTMIAPSPDWFLGVHGEPLTIDGWWIPEVDIDLYPYDAGTDHGPDFDSPDADADPQDPIAAIAAPFSPGVPLGSFRIRRLPEPAFALTLGVGVLAMARGARARRARAAFSPREHRPSDAH